MRTACERRCASVMNQLRGLMAGNPPSAPGNGTPLVDGFYFSWDKEEAQVDLTLERPAGDKQARLAGQPAMARFRARVSGKPRWLSLNVSLDTQDFAAGDVLALVGALHCPEAESLPAFLRSDAGGAQGDTPFSEPLRCAGAAGIGVSLHTVQPADKLLAPGAFHTLIVPLPPHDFTLLLGDLRFITLPASAGLRSQPPSLASYAL